MFESTKTGPEHYVHDPAAVYRESSIFCKSFCARASLCAWATHAASQHVTVAAWQVTHLFRDVLHGWGQIMLSVNVSPCAKDYDETSHVLKVSSVLHTHTRHDLQHDLIGKKGSCMCNNLQYAWLCSTFSCTSRRATPIANFVLLAFSHDVWCILPTAKCTVLKHSIFTANSCYVSAAHLQKSLGLSLQHPKYCKMYH